MKLRQYLDDLEVGGISLGLTSRCLILLLRRFDDYTHYNCILLPFTA